MRDAIVIGAGPAGISASLYIKRAGHDVLVLYKDNGALEKATKIENYYALPATGKQIAMQGIKQAQDLGIEIRKEEVVEIEYDYEQKFFNVKADKQYQTKTVVLATGNNRKTLNIEGIKELEGKGISYCAVCDAFFYKNKDVAIVGNGRYAINEINHLKNVVNSIVLLTQGENPPDTRGEIEVIPKKIAKIEGENKVEDVIFEDNTKRKLDGIFIALGTANATDFGKKLGLNIQQNNIIVDNQMQTNMPGIFACGDCTGGLLQISKAVYEGTKAGLSVIDYLRKIKEEN